MSNEIGRDYYPCNNSTADDLRSTLDAITRTAATRGLPEAAAVRYVWIGDRPLAEVQVKRTLLTDGSVVEDVLLIPGPDVSREP